MSESLRRCKTQRQHSIAMRHVYPFSSAGLFKGERGRYRCNAVRHVRQADRQASTQTDLVKSGLAVAEKHRVESEGAHQLARRLVVKLNPHILTQRGEWRWFRKKKNQKKIKKTKNHKKSQKKNRQCILHQARTTLSRT